MKDKKMSIRISEDDLNIVHYKAEQAKLTLTEYVTQCALGKQIFVIDGLDEVIRQQKAIGKNLNRLTVLCNMGKISNVNLELLTEEYAELNRTLTCGDCSTTVCRTRKPCTTEENSSPESTVWRGQRSMRW